jgi:hypothetical protein
MWNSLKPDFLARLPRSTAGEHGNGTHGAPVLASPSEWESCFERLEEYRSYTDDWDGQGAILGKPAKAIPGDLIDSAAALMSALRAHSIAAPSYTYPGVQGTVGFEWELVGGAGVSMEVIEAGVADVFFDSPGKESEHLVLTETVAA